MTFNAREAARRQEEHRRAQVVERAVKAAQRPVEQALAGRNAAQAATNEDLRLTCEALREALLRTQLAFRELVLALVDGSVEVDGKRGHLAVPAALAVMARLDGEEVPGEWSEPRPARCKMYEGATLCGKWNQGWAKDWQDVECGACLAQRP